TTGEPLTPPLRHAMPLTYAAFSSDSKRVLIAADFGAVRIWNLALDSHATAEETLRRIQLQNSHQVSSSTGRIVPLDVATTQQQWKNLRDGSPRQAVSTG